jgi:hypothetical protein
VHDFADVLAGQAFNVGVAHRHSIPRGQSPQCRDDFGVGQGSESLVLGRPQAGRGVLGVGSELPVAGDNFRWRKIKHSSRDGDRLDCMHIPARVSRNRRDTRVSEVQSQLSMPPTRGVNNSGVAKKQVLCQWTREIIESLGREYHVLSNRRRCTWPKSDVWQAAAENQSVIPRRLGRE